MLSYAKSGTARTGDRLNGFKKGKTQVGSEDNPKEDLQSVLYPGTLDCQSAKLQHIFSSGTFILM